MSEDATGFINAIQSANEGSPDQLLPLVYQELRGLARAQMSNERGGHTLQATALVHEAFMRLVGDRFSSWENRRLFFAAAAEAMRRILIEHARRRNALKNGGDHQYVHDAGDDLLPVIQSPVDDITDLLSLDEALNRFAELDPDKAELVKLLFFTGLNLDDAASALGISRSTAHRHWLYARAWLFDAMGQAAR